MKESLSNTCVLSGLDVYGLLLDFYTIYLHIGLLMHSQFISVFVDGVLYMLSMFALNEHFW